MYEKKLRRLLESGRCDEQANGEEENAVLYSDSEDEKDGENKLYFFWLVDAHSSVVYCSVTCAESEGDKEETAEESVTEQSQQEMSQVSVSATEYPLVVRNERTCTTM